MKEIETRAFDAANYLETREDMAAYLEAAIEYGDNDVITAALGDIARSKGMAQIAKDTGIGRERLCKSLSAGGNPEFGTILKVLEALGLKLRAIPSSKDEAA